MEIACLATLQQTRFYNYHRSNVEILWWHIMDVDQEKTRAVVVVGGGGVGGGSGDKTV